MNTLSVENIPLRVLRPLVAKLRGCSTQTVKRAEQAGLLDPIRPNSRVVLYTRASVIDWLSLQPEEITK